MAAVKLAAAHIDENGRATGGKAGDQTGREVCVRAYYVHSKGWRVLRPRSAAAADMIAQDAQAACDNPHIGYDQNQRESLYTAAEPYGFNCAKVKTNCETDCSALVRVCCAYAGIDLPNFTTVNEAQVLLDSGAFVELTGAKYINQSTYLRRGDILVTRTKGHTEIVLTDGNKAGVTTATTTRVLQNGMSGSDVKALQQKLIKAGYSCGPYGADGDFGDQTEMAVRRFQTQHGLAVDGQAGPKTIAALDKLLAAQTEPDNPAYVEIKNGNCYVRSEPDTDGEIRGVALEGSKLVYGGKKDNGWLAVVYKDRPGWVSGKYGRLVSDR